MASPSSPPDILEVIRSSLSLQSHHDLLQWLQHDVRPYVPHDVMVAAWGDFTGARICLDVISPLPGMRTQEIRTESLQPLLASSFDAWNDGGRAPFVFSADGGGTRHPLDLPRDGALAAMRGILVHGVRDERSGQDCLYVAFHRCARLPHRSLEMMELLTPYLDAALRRVAHLPTQVWPAAAARSATAVQAGGNVRPLDGSSSGETLLSRREREIMRWVRAGKTNDEIARILGISPRTVRNHLQSVFRKLEVTNRAQAVSRFDGTRA